MIHGTLSFCLFLRMHEGELEIYPVGIAGALCSDKPILTFVKQGEAM